MHNPKTGALGSLIGPAIGGVLALSLLTSTAPAQNDRFIEGPRRETAAQEAIKTTQCDHPTLTVVRTENTPSTFANTAFATLPGSVITFETFGDRCVKVLFTAKVAATAHCFVRALVNGRVMDPNGEGGQTLVSVDTSFDAHGFAWVGRVDGGDHTVLIQRRVNSGTCTMDDWTVDLEVWND